MFIEIATNKEELRSIIGYTIFDHEGCLCVRVGLMNIVDVLMKLQVVLTIRLC